MKTNFAVFATDQVTRDKIRIPASELLLAYEWTVAKAIRTDIPLGLPMHMQHDMHRLIGWSRPLGIYIDNAMVRAIGEICMPATDAEMAKLQDVADLHWANHHREGTEAFQDEMKTRAAPVNVVGAQFLRMESAVLFQPGIASELYPELFTPGHGLVDKDGLTDYRDLIRFATEIQPGVFHEPRRDILLFAHRFFRRSLSHRNKLNTYFLQSFGEITKANPELRVRIKLDPDILGHPASAQMLVEMEYWHGHKYSDDIGSIRSGVAEHKSDARNQKFHGIDRTHLWWKEPESRVIDGQQVVYRTFEVEELTENESCGLGADKYGCRYAHAEFSGDEAAITHFDGAIRAYDAEAYLNRIDKLIDKAGKHADYTKVFRFDGPLAISDWKLLLTNYFQGNALIPEYLGAPTIADEKSTLHSDAENDEPDLMEASLAILVSLTKGTVPRPIALCSELFVQFGEVIVPIVEVGLGAVETYLRGRHSLEAITSIGFEDGVLNLSRICFGESSAGTEFFRSELALLADAISQDIEAGLIVRASVPLTWNVNDLLCTLSVAGDAKKVVDALKALSTLVDIKKHPSELIESISRMVKSVSQGPKSQVMWHDCRRGVLSIERAGTVTQRFQMPEHLQSKLKDSGDLKIQKIFGS